MTPLCDSCGNRESYGSVFLSKLSKLFNMSEVNWQSFGGHFASVAVTGGHSDFPIYCVLCDSQMGRESHGFLFLLQVTDGTKVLVEPKNWKGCTWVKHLNSQPTAVPTLPGGGGVNDIRFKKKNTAVCYSYILSLTTVYVVGEGV